MPLTYPQSHHREKQSIRKIKPVLEWIGDRDHWDKYEQPHFCGSELGGTSVYQVSVLLGTDDGKIPGQFNCIESLLLEPWCWATLLLKMQELVGKQRNHIAPGYIRHQSGLSLAELCNDWKQWGLSTSICVIRCAHTTSSTPLGQLMSSSHPGGKWVSISSSQLTFGLISWSQQATLV